MEKLLTKEGGVSLERVLRGGALYRSVRTPNIGFMHQSFLVLYRMKPCKTPDDALKNLLSSGSWLDNIPFDTIEGKRFRITVSDGENKVPANMRYVNLLENTIREHTGLQVNRERPDVELWLICLPEMSLFLWRIDQSRNKEKGRLRPDVAYAAASYIGYNQENVAVIGCEDESLIAALKAQSARHIVCVCTTEESCKRVSSVARGVKTVLAGIEQTGLSDHSQSAVYLNLRASQKENTRIDVRSALYEATRMLEEDGKLIIVCSKGQVYADLFKTRSLEIEDKLSFVLGGQETVVWALSFQPDEEEPAEA